MAAYNQYIAELKFHWAISYTR